MAKEKPTKDLTEKPDKKVTIEIPQGQFPVVLYANTFGLESLDGHKLVHFGLMMIINLLIGALTPPFGVLLFITMDIAKVSFAAIVRAIIPFYVPLAVVLLMVTYWPEMVMFLPNLFKD